MAAGNVSATLGFFVAGKARPMTLLKGNELNMAKAKKLDLVLRRKSGESKFSEVLLGDENQLAEHKDSLKELLSDKLLKFIVDDCEGEENDDSQIINIRTKSLDKTEKL